MHFTKIKSRQAGFLVKRQRFDLLNILLIQYITYYIVQAIDMNGQSLGMVMVTAIQTD